MQKRMSSCFILHRQRLKQVNIVFSLINTAMYGAHVVYKSKFQLLRMHVENQCHFKKYIVLRI